MQYPLCPLESCDAERPATDLQVVKQELPEAGVMSMSEPLQNVIRSATLAQENIMNNNVTEISLNIFASNADRKWSGQMSA